MMPKLWFKKMPKETKIEEMLPLLALIDASTVITKSGQYCSVLALDGLDYTGIAPDILTKVTNARREFLKDLEEGIHINQHWQRIKQGSSQIQKLDDGSVTHKIRKGWLSKFHTSYRTAHFIVITTDRAGSLGDIEFISTSENDENLSTRDHLKTERLQNTIRAIQVYLKDYQPKLLNDDELLSFFSGYINGVFDDYQAVPPYGMIGDYLSAASIVFPGKKAHQFYENGNERFSSWISIKFFQGSNVTTLIEELNQERVEFTIYQGMKKITRSKALEMLEDKEHKIVAFSKYGGIALEEIQAAKELLQSNDLSFLEYSFSAQIFADSEEQLKDDRQKILSIINRYGYKAILEKINIEPLFWSQLPTLHRLNARKRPLTNIDIADMTPLSVSGQGLPKCSFGDSPMTKFHTTQNSEYSFVLHETQNRNALGHTLVFGGSDSGKTTLVNFLISQMLHYPGFKAMLFDSLNGMNVFTKMHDGIYNDFNTNEISINPLQLPETPGNKDFLRQFIKVISKRYDEQSEHQIDKAVKANYSLLQQNDRTFDKLIPFFGLTQTGSISYSLSKFTSKGAEGRFFNAPKDSLSFDAPIVTFNMDGLFDNPELLQSMSYYLFHRLKTRTLTIPTPHALVIDEARKYLKDEYFSKLLIKEILEMRKRNGLAIMMMQSASHITELDYAADILGSFANAIFFADPLAKREQLVDVFGLTETEYEWITTKAKPRQILFKRLKGASVILDVDLSSLGSLLKVFDSSTEAVLKLNDLLRTKPTSWKEDFLK